LCFCWWIAPANLAQSFLRSGPVRSHAAVLLALDYFQIRAKCLCSEDGTDKEDITDCDPCLIQPVRWSIPLKTERGGASEVRLTFAPPPADAAAG